MAKFYRIIPFTLVLVLFAASIGLLDNRSKKNDVFKMWLRDMDGYDIYVLIKMAESGRADGFKAIFKLSEKRDTIAVSALERVLRGHPGTDDIFGAAAARALLCMGTREALNVLEQCISAGKHVGVKWEIDCVFNKNLETYYKAYREMKQVEYDSFIRQRNQSQSASNGIEIKVEAVSQIEKGVQKITFTATLTNTSENTLYLYIPGIYTGNLFLFCSEDGHFMRYMQTFECKYAIKPVSFTKLDFGKSTSIVATVASGRSKIPSLFLPGLYQNEVFILDFRDMVHIIEKPGRFKVYAVFSADKDFVDAQAERLGLPPAWSGRVVSEPVEIEILPID